MAALACEKCHRTRVQMTCHLDVYNDFDGQPGNLICDDCLFAEMDDGPAVLMPARPEGYYHLPIGTFD